MVGAGFVSGAATRLKPATPNGAVITPESGSIWTNSVLCVWKFYNFFCFVFCGYHYIIEDKQHQIKLIIIHTFFLLKK